MTDYTGVKIPASRFVCFLSFFFIINGYAAERGNTITITNNTSEDQVIYLQLEQGNGQQLSSETKTYYQNTIGCTFPDDPAGGQGNDHTCHFILTKNNSTSVAIGANETHLNPGKLIVSISAEENHYPQGPCNTTLAEFTLDDNNLDSYDVSLVNGQNFNMSIQSDTGNPPISLNSSNLKTIKKTLGVYPPGCSRCVDGIGVPPAWPGEPQKNTQNCPGFSIKPPGPMPKGSCKEGDEMKPKPNPCQITSKPTGGNYTVIFSDKTP